MSLDSAINYFRSKQAALFAATCTITRSVGEPTFNPSTGEYTPAGTTTIYTGACNVRPRGSGSDVQVGEQELRLSTYVGKLPVNTAVKKDDVLTVTASTYDAGMVGKSFRITDVPSDGWQIARAVGLEEVT
jgi:hypothetical protein